MITDINQLISDGAIFPPRDSEVERFIEYDMLKALYDGDIELAYPRMNPKLAENMRLDGKIVRVFDPTILNYPKLSVKKKSDLIWGTHPSIVHTTDTAKEKDILRVLKNTDAFNMLKKAHDDSLIYGNGAFVIYNKTALIFVNDELIAPAKAGVKPVMPKYWVPVVSQFNEFETVANAIGSIYIEVDEAGNENYYLQLNVYYDTDYDIYTFAVGDPVNGTVTIRNTIPEKTKLGIRFPNETNPIKVFHNFGDTERGLFGESSFVMFYNVLGKIIERYTQIQKILDKHAMPTLTGPKEALTKDEKTGEEYLAVGAYIGIPSSSDRKVEYLTWDAQLASAYKEIEKLINVLYQMSETGSAFLGETDDAKGFAPSARALKIRMVSPIASANAWIDMNKNTILQAIADLCKINGVNVDWHELEIKFNINLPEDALEQAQISATKISAGLVSRIEENIRLGMNREGAEEEFKAWLKEQEMIKAMEAKYARSGGIGDDDNTAVDRRRLRSGEAQRNSNAQL